MVLVYRECVCGWWCATGEGAVAPVCPGCGRNAMPVSAGDDYLAFTASLVDERDAVAAADYDPAIYPGQRERHLDPDVIAADLAQRKLPTERLWGPYPTPPWYPVAADAEPHWPRSDWTEYGREIACS